MLGLLLAVNLANYMDRQALYAVLPGIQEELRLNDAQAGRLASAFMVVYMAAALPAGFLADRWGRRRWISLGIALWSAATAACGLARNYGELFAARAAVGIGESCYGAISPSFVAEHFPASSRSRVLALFSMAIPVGSALGYIVAAILEGSWGWRSAFFIIGPPGAFLAWLAWRLQDPPAPAEANRAAPAFSSYLSLFRIRSFALVTLAGAAMTFALGGLAVWMPSFLHRQWGMSVAQAGTLFGAVTVVAGVLGSLCGGWVSDRVLRFNSRAYFLVSGVGLLLGMPLAAAALLSAEPTLSIAFLFLAEFFLFLNMGPLNAVIVSVTDLNRRSMAFAANMLVIHALGDAISPALIGMASDRFGLQGALLGASLALGLAGILCLRGMAHYDRDAASVHG